MTRLAFLVGLTSLAISVTVDARPAADGDMHVWNVVETGVDKRDDKVKPDDPNYDPNFDDIEKFCDGFDATDAEGAEELWYDTGAWRSLDDFIEIHNSKC